MSHAVSSPNGLGPEALLGDAHPPPDAVGYSLRPGKESCAQKKPGPGDTQDRVFGKGHLPSNNANPALLHARPWSVLRGSAFLLFGGLRSYGIQDTREEPQRKEAAVLHAAGEFGLTSSPASSGYFLGGLAETENAAIRPAKDLPSGIYPVTT
jgi:hypothetical protein